MGEMMTVLWLCLFLFLLESGKTSNIVEFSLEKCLQDVCLSVFVSGTDGTIIYGGRHYGNEMIFNIKQLISDQTGMPVHFIQIHDDSLRIRYLDKSYLRFFAPKVRFQVIFTADYNLFTIIDMTSSSSISSNFVVKPPNIFKVHRLHVMDDSTVESATEYLSRMVRDELRGTEILWEFAMHHGALFPPLIGFLQKSAVLSDFYCLPTTFELLRGEDSYRDYLVIRQSSAERCYSTQICAEGGEEEEEEEENEEENEDENEKLNLGEKSTTAQKDNEPKDSGSKFRKHSPFSLAFFRFKYKSYDTFCPLSIWKPESTIVGRKQIFSHFNSSLKMRKGRRIYFGGLFKADDWWHIYEMIVRPEDNVGHVVSQLVDRLNCDDIFQAFPIEKHSEMYLSDIASGDRNLDFFSILTGGIRIRFDQKFDDVFGSHNDFVYFINWQYSPSVTIDVLR